MEIIRRTRTTPAPTPQQVTNAIPKNRALPDNRVVVNWGVDEAQTLKNMNIRLRRPLRNNINGQVAMRLRTSEDHVCVPNHEPQGLLLQRAGHR